VQPGPPAVATSGAHVGHGVGLRAPWRLCRRSGRPAGQG
jgi:hypothetical protein